MITDALSFCFGDLGEAVQPFPTTPTLSTNRSPQIKTRSTQNVVTCLYRTAINGHCHMVSITWCESLMGVGLSVSLDAKRFSVDLKPWHFWKKQGSKSFDLSGKRIDIFWDLSSAKYANSPEPCQSFYVAIGYESEPVLVLGDMHEECLKNFHVQEPPSKVALLSRKEYVDGKELYTTKTQLHSQGRAHDIAIECHVSADCGSPCLSVLVDTQKVIHVTSLLWKFRGNQTIKIDGAAIDVFWDVHNWLFKGEEGHAVFMFHTCCAQAKLWHSELEGPYITHTDVHMLMNKPHCISDSLWASVLQWPTQEKEQGFSVLLYAWNH